MTACVASQPAPAALLAADAMPSPAKESGLTAMRRQERAGVMKEIGLMWRLTWPTFVSTILRSGTQQTTMILVGHLGSRELGAVALGTLWVSMTGMSLVFGGMSGLDTLASQAYGARNYVSPTPHPPRALCLPR